MGSYSSGWDQGYAQARHLSPDDLRYCADFCREGLWRLPGLLPWDMLAPLAGYDMEVPAHEVINDLRLEKPAKYLLGAVRGAAAYWWNTVGRCYDLGIPAPDGM